MGLPSAADTLWDYQAVNANGTGIHPAVGADYSITFEGIALAGHNELQNPDIYGMPNAYTLVVQDDTSDRGGIQCWAGTWIYPQPMWWQARGVDSWPYGPVNPFINFQAGDRLRVTGYIADPPRGGGKVFMNSRHSSDPDMVFYVTVLGHPGLPDPQLIPSISDCNYFDQTRAGGGERWQSRYTMLHGVEVQSGNWINNGDLTIQDSTGALWLKLSEMGDFNAEPQPSGKLNIVGIFDQEDLSAPYTSNYRIWIKKSIDVASAKDNCRELAQCDIDTRVGIIDKKVSRVFDGYFFVQDKGRAGGIKVLSSHAVIPGDIVALQGKLVADSGGKALEARYCTVTSSGDAPKPIYVNGLTLNGQAGLKVDNLLIKCVGKIKSNLGGGMWSFKTIDGVSAELECSQPLSTFVDKNISVIGIASVDGIAPKIFVGDTEDIKEL